MTMIDPTARIEAGARIGNNVAVGPYCVVGPHVAIADDCRLVAHVHPHGHLGLFSVAAEGGLTDHQPDEEAAIEVRELRHEQNCFTA